MLELIECNTVLRVKPRLINVCGSLKLQRMAYAMLITFIDSLKNAIASSLFQGYCAVRYIMNGFNHPRKKI